jgi:hypothetical protein
MADMTAKSIKAWAVFDENGDMELETVSLEKKGAIHAFLPSFSMASALDDFGEYLSRGYTVRPITITEGH